MNHELLTPELATLIAAAQPQIQEVTVHENRVFIPDSAIRTGSPFDLEKFQGSPNRIKESPTFVDVPSFSAYVNRFKESDTLVFGQSKAGKITAKLDYHGVDSPSWSTHQAVLDLRKTDDFKKWEAVNDKPLSQNAFAEFLEDMAHTVIAPDSASLIELAMKAEATKGLKFEQKANRTDGSVTFLYSETVGTKGQWKLPTSLHVAVPIFEASKPTNLFVQLRYRVGEEGITFRLVLTQLDKLMLDEFRAVSDEVAAKVELQVLQQ